ncbi:MULTISPECIES: hypothetical protein [Arthrobacter]|uniref:DUF222 domain-containing protein n=2 Tax=Arthrobacter TaxID=1663 RepID=A0ABU9KI03_9MICC|nr:hypothetical protein [Arthrobacter sp. YJM1]MDP5226454.1 hypothetical protein [Arthrobacter sp. YJM1]
MVTSDGLPESLTEYLKVWCADLLGRVDTGSRKHIIDAACMSYEGGPWPRRLMIQRHVEISQGILSTEAWLGLVTHDLAGGVPGAIHRLSTENRVAAVEQLSRMPGTPELVAGVNAASARGELSSQERVETLRRALAQPPAPAEIPLPGHLRPVPADYPESFEEWKRRDPPYELVLDSEPAPRIRPDEATIEPALREWPENRGGELHDAVLRKPGLSATSGRTNQSS